MVSKDELKAIGPDGWRRIGVGPSAKRAQIEPYKPGIRDYWNALTDAQGWWNDIKSGGTSDAILGMFAEAAQVINEDIDWLMGTDTGSIVDQARQYSYGNEDAFETGRIAGRFTGKAYEAIAIYAIAAPIGAKIGAAIVTPWVARGHPMGTSIFLGRAA